IKMRRLDPDTGKPADKYPTVYSLCSRPREQPIGGSVEAPFIVKHDAWWYLFVSYDRCCRGVNSTYNVVVARPRQITGPYLDKDGKSLAEGGGTLVIAATTPNWRGPGHQAILQEPGQDYLVFRLPRHYRTLLPADLDYALGERLAPRRSASLSMPLHKFTQEIGWQAKAPAPQVGQTLSSVNTAMRERSPGSTGS